MNRLRRNAEFSIIRAAVRRWTPGEAFKALVPAATALLVLPIADALAQDALPAGFQSQPVLTATKTRDNDPIVYPNRSMPEIVSALATMQMGGRTALHEHPIPTYVYILEGEVELRTEGGQPQKYKAGEAYIEALNRKHQLFNTGSVPAKLLVVFIGETGRPTTVAAQ